MNEDPPEPPPETGGVPLFVIPDTACEAAYASLRPTSDGESLELLLGRVETFDPPVPGPEIPGLDAEEAPRSVPFFRPLVGLRLRADQARAIGRMLAAMGGTVRRALCLPEPEQDGWRLEGEAVPGPLARIEVGPSTPATVQDGELVLGRGHEAVIVAFQDRRALYRVEQTLHRYRTHESLPPDRP